MSRYHLEMRAVLALFSGGLAVIFVACETTKPDLPVGAEVDFERHVKPVLEKNCLICHNRAATPGRTSFETRELAMHPGRNGPAIIPGDPDSSRMVNFINAPRDQGVAMPKVGHVISEEDAETIREWIAAGAEWPEGEAGRLVVR